MDGAHVCGRASECLFALIDVARHVADRAEDASEKKRAGSVWEHIPAPREDDAVRKIIFTVFVVRPQAPREQSVFSTGMPGPFAGTTRANFAALPTSEPPTVSQMN